MTTGSAVEQIMAGELGAVVEGQRAAQRGRDGGERADEVLDNAGGML